MYILILTIVPNISTSTGESVAAAVTSIEFESETAAENAGKKWFDMNNELDCNWMVVPK